MKTEEIKYIIEESIVAINNSSRLHDPINVNEEIVFNPEYGILSSLDFVYLLVGIEERLQAKTNTKLSVLDIVSQKAMEDSKILNSQDHLAAFIQTELGDEE